MFERGLHSRARRRRCDGAKPICHNCRRRYPGRDQCEYASEAKRRGKEKVPQARKRSAKGVRAPRRTHRQILEELEKEERTDSSGEPSVEPSASADDSEESVFWARHQVSQERRLSANHDQSNGEILSFSFLICHLIV